MSAVIPDPALTDWVPLWSLGAPSGLVMVEDKLLGAAAASLDFQNIPQTYQHLRLVASLRGDTAAEVASLLTRLNNDSGGNYDSETLVGVASTAAAGPVAAATSWSLDSSVLAATARANRFSPVALDLPDYASTTREKSGLLLAGTVNPGATSMLRHNAVAWRSVAAINRLTLFPSAGNFAAGSRATLYALTDVTAPPAVWTPPTYGTSLPGSPADGQEHTLVDSLTNPTYQWRFRYNAGNSTAYKWEFIGGTPINKEEAAVFNGTVQTYVDPTTTPSFTLPRAGVYDVHYGAAGSQTTNDEGYISLYIGAIATDANGVRMFRGDQGSYVNDRHLAVTAAASTLLKIQQRYTPATGGSSFGTKNRFLHITPVRVS